MTVHHALHLPCRSEFVVASQDKFGSREVRVVHKQLHAKQRFLILAFLTIKFQPSLESIMQLIFKTYLNSFLEKRILYNCFIC